MIHLISPAYNEEDGIQHFCKEVIKFLPPDHRIYIVDDGSKDQSYQRVVDLIESSPDYKIEAIRLSKNFGHQSAVHAGLSHAFCRAQAGDYFVVMDSDLQHPPKLIPSILEALEKNLHHVQMIRLDSESGVSLFKKLTSSLFYRLFSWLSQTRLPKGGSDFRGFSYEFVKAYLQLTETNRFNRGLFLWMGFASLQIPYAPDVRFAGSSKYSLWKMFRLGFHGITQFSNKPLILIHLLMSVMSIGFCSIYLIVELVYYSLGYPFEPGWPTIVFLISFWGGLLALGNLMTSLYIGLIFDEVKNRPIFITEKTYSSKEP